MEKLYIELCDTGSFGDEAEQFCEWLNKLGHSAKIKSWESYCYINGENTDWNPDAAAVLSKFWSAYCEDTPEARKSLSVSAMEKSLWIDNERFMTETEKRAACDEAEQAIHDAGFTVDEAYAAHLAEIDGQEFDTAAAEAWKAADRIALHNAPSESAVLTVA